MRINKFMLACATAAVAFGTPALAQSRADDSRLAAAQARLDREFQIFRTELDRYRSLRGSRNGGFQQQQGYNNGQYNNNGQFNDRQNDERVENDYEPSRFYRDGDRYQERVLAADERVYRGNDGRYYCKRSDGTTGLIIGAAGGGILGNVIDGGRSRTVGTLIGAALGGLAGRAVDRNQAEVRCR